MQRTLKREFKELEIVKREATEVSYSIASGEIQLARGSYLVGRLGGGRRGACKRLSSSFFFPSDLCLAGSEFFLAGPSFSWRRASISFPFNPFPSREKRSKGRLIPSGIKISLIFARRWGDACAGKPSGRLRHIFKRAPSRGLWHPGPLSGLGENWRPPRGVGAR